MVIDGTGPSKSVAAGELDAAGKSVAAGKVDAAFPGAAAIDYQRRSCRDCISIHGLDS